MFQDSPDSPHVKQNLISIITNLVYKVPQELPNDLKIRKLGSTGNISDLETQPSAQCHFQKLNQLKSTQKQIAKFSSSAQCCWMSLPCPKYFVQEDSKAFQLCPMILNFFTLSRILFPGSQIFIILTKQLNITFNNYQLYFKVFLPQLPSEGRWVEEIGDGGGVISLTLTFCNSQGLCEKLQNCQESRATYAVAENVQVTLQDKILQINSQVFLWSVLQLIFMADYLRFRCPVTHSASIPSSLWIFLKFAIFQRS